MNTSVQPRSRQGMTLAELLVAMAVTALLAFFVLPFYVSMLTVAYKTSGVLFNTDALRSFSTQFAGDVQGSSNFRLVDGDRRDLSTLVDGASNHVRLTYSNPRTGAVTRIVGYYLDTSEGGNGPWPVRRYEVLGSVMPDLSEASVRATHEIQARVTPVQAGQLFQTIAGQRTVFINGNVVTPGSNTSKAINSLRVAVSLR